MSTLSGIAKTLVLPMAGVMLGLGLWMVQPHDTLSLAERMHGVSPTTFFDSPVYVGSAEAPSDDQPQALTLHDGRLLVSYAGRSRIDELSNDMTVIRSIDVPGDSTADITALAVDAGRLFAVDHRTGELLIFSYETGEFLQAYGTLPDGTTRLNLYGMSIVGGLVYASDEGLQRILAISTTEIPGIREAGELLTAFPSPAQARFQLNAPSFVHITTDGRLLVADVGNSDVKVFSCNGRPIGRFEGPPGSERGAPMGIAMDGLPSPAFLAAADTVFDPSGMLEQGRVHVVDATLGRVLVYDAAGAYVLTYGEELDRPNGIAIDTTRRLIFIADAGHRAVMIYTY